MKTLFLIAGLVLLAAIWGGPLLSTSRDSFAAHMIAHMGVVAVAAPLLALGIGGRAGMAGSPGRGATSLPVVASLVDLAVVWGWHAPALRELSEGSVAVTAVEQATFLGAGLLLWGSAFAGADRSAAGAAAGAFALLFTSIHMTLLGALLALSPRPLFGAGEVTCLGLTLDAADDQALGGVVMLMVGAAVYLAGGLHLTARLLRRRESGARRA